MQEEYNYEYDDARSFDGSCENIREKQEKQEMKKEMKKNAKRMEKQLKTFYEIASERFQNSNDSDYVEEEKTLERKEVKDLKCFQFYNKEFIYPVFSYCLLAVFMPLLDYRLKPKVILQIYAKEANILQYYKNISNDIAYLWGETVGSYSVRESQNILEELSHFENEMVIWNVENNSHIQAVKETITEMQMNLKNGYPCKYPFIALPLICSKYNNTSDEIYTIVLKKSTENRNIAIITELGNYIYNFLSELDFKHPSVYDKELNINENLGKKYDEYTNKFSKCAGEKPFTWLQFECLLISTFSYFIDVTLYDKNIEEREELLKEAESAILGIKFQDSKQVLFDEIFEEIILLKEDKERILSERPKDDLVDKFLKNENQIGFTTEIEKIGKVLCFKTNFLEKFVSERNIDKTEFLNYVYKNNKLHYNTTKGKVKYDVNITLKKGDKSSTKKFYSFYL